MPACVCCPDQTGSLILASSGQWCKPVTRPATGRPWENWDTVTCSWGLDGGLEREGVARVLTLI